MDLQGVGVTVYVKEKGKGHKYTKAWHEKGLADASPLHMILKEKHYTLLVPDGDWFPYDKRPAAQMVSNSKLEPPQKRAKVILKRPANAC